MKPPLRESLQSTSRRLVTFASIGRPRMSNRTVSPTLIENRWWMLRSTDTSGLAEGPCQNSPSMSCSFGRSEERRVGKECRSRWGAYDEKKKERKVRDGV